MKSLSATFQNRLKNGGTLAYGLRVTTVAGSTYGYTTFNRSVSFGGVTYKPNNGVNPGANETSIGLQVGNSEAQIFFDDAEISEDDVLSGKLDQAQIVWFVFDWHNLPSSIDLTVNEECLVLLRGSFGKFRGADLQFTGEILTTEDRLSQSNPIVTTPRCRNSLGDDGCLVSLIRTFTGAASNADGTSFSYTPDAPGAIAEEAGYCSNGRLVWVTGNNTGDEIKISEHNAGQIILSQLPYRTIQDGDRFIAYAGCDKTTIHCDQKFSNIENMAAEPHLPGNDRLIKNPR